MAAANSTRSGSVIGSRSSDLGVVWVSFSAKISVTTDFRDRTRLCLRLGSDVALLPQAGR